MHPVPSGIHVLLCANDLWNVANFRLGLVQALEAGGYRVSIAAPPDPGWTERLRAPDRAVFPLPMRKEGLSPWQEVLLLARFVQLLRRERPDVLLTFTPKPNIYGALAASLTGIAAVPNVSGLGTAFIRGGALRRLLSLLYRTSFRRIPQVFFQNAEDLQLFVTERLVRADQAALLPGSGVNLDRFRPVPARKPDGATRFLFIGRLLGDKGVRELVAAARELKRRNVPARVQLVGFVDAENRTAISRTELDSWVADGIVDYLGAADDVRPFIAASDAVVLPSYREGLPRSLLEAAAMATPLIASDVPGNRSVVVDGENGFLCRVADPHSLAAAMERFVQLAPDERRNMGEQARDKVVAGFSDEKVFEAYRQVIGRLTDTRAKN